MGFLSRNQTRLAALLLAAGPIAALGAKPTSLADYTGHLQSLRGLIERCEASPGACDPEQVGSDDRVRFDGLGAGANVSEFEVRYDWLRKALKAARDPGVPGRESTLAAAAARIEDAQREAGAKAEGDQFAIARNKTDAILGHTEFATVNEQNIWQKILAGFFMWLDNLFSAVARFGRRSPWIGPVLEWGLVGLALASLAFWVMRALERQRLAVRAEASRQIEPWEEASRNWRSLAEEQAARQEWREAIHCLYWASIVMLEGRRFWTPNRSRTPREYVGLLEPGSTRWRLLGQQTRGFERIWYGLNPADAKDYSSALELHEQLRTA